MRGDNYKEEYGVFSPVNEVLKFYPVCPAAPAEGL